MGGRTVALLLAAAAGAARASDTKWSAPTSAELSMTAEPKAPGAPAIILSYSEIEDGESAELTVHVRIKVLTEGGVTAGNIEVPVGFGLNNDDFSKAFSGRTIHADGSVIPFVQGTASTTVAGKETRAVALPQVQVGSILEYVLHYAGVNTLYTILTRYYAPTWNLQGKFFTKSAHLTLLVPADLEKDSTRWVANLPPGAQLKRTKNRVDLELSDVPALPDEPFMPPVSAAAYSVRFFYYDGSRDKYWGYTGALVDDEWSNFDRPTRGLTDAVHGMISPTDSDEVKLHKLYDAVQKFDNTELTRTHSQQEENKTSVHALNSAQDIWNRKRGDQEDLTLLFIALARAAGYQAYPMAVASRGEAVFDQNVLSWAQMDSMVAIVAVNGHEVFFDPGTRMCPFAHMSPRHSNVIGVSTEAKLVKVRTTPGEAAKSSRTERTADVTLAPDGSVTGTVKVTWTMNAALELRQQAIREDQHAVETSIEKEFQDHAPAGVGLKFKSIVGLQDVDGPLVATLDISGRMGQATRKRIVVPSQFFESAAKSPLVGDVRTQPVAFPSTYTGWDQMKLHLPAGFSVESLPDSRSTRIASDSGYAANALPSANDSGMIITQRAFSLNRLDYKAEEYRAVHQYFEQVADYDHDQILLQEAKGPAATPAGQP